MSRPKRRALRGRPAYGCESRIAAPEQGSLKMKIGILALVAALAAVSPTIASANPNNVPLYSNDGWRSMNIDVLLGDGVFSDDDRRYGYHTHSPFVIDTGASNMTVTYTIALALLNYREADLGPNAVVSLADGSRKLTQTIVIHQVTVANRSANNVPAVVVPDGTEMLLGMSVLSALGVSVDLASHTLHATKGPQVDDELPVDKAFHECMKTSGATYARCHYYAFGTK
jgi:clan AA aspartic protease (TIGR02281 family)